ncbi:MAG TPA: ankyrin repeat domain-containing protein, partial [Planctomycetota bacterium]|nr:ankyrin repeat domain-containing protein [Planctomycetota bacterium]
LSASTITSPNGSTNRTPLHLAAWRGHLTMAEMLIERGANINAVDIAFQTPLHLAAIEGHEALVRLLIDRRADVIHLLALEEMLKQARCHRLFLLVLDAVGPVPRLLDVSLPLGEGVLGQVARVALKREQDALTATFEFESKNLQAQGEAWPTELSRLAAAAEHKADLVLVSASKVSMAELFAALDALTPLGVGAIRVVP